MAKDISPIRPVIITTDENLPLDGNALGGNLYVVPAIFLKFKGDKQFNSDAADAAYHPFDPVFLVFTSGGNTNEQKSLNVPAITL